MCYPPHRVRVSRVRCARVPAIPSCVLVVADVACCALLCPRRRCSLLYPLVSSSPMWPAVPSCALVADVESASFLSTTRSPRGPLGMPCRSPAPPFFVAARRCHAVWLRVRRWHADIDRIASYILPARPMSRHRFQRASEVSAPLVELTPRTAEPAVLCCNEHEKQLADCCIAADFLCMLFTYVDLHNLPLGGGSLFVSLFLS